MISLRRACELFLGCVFAVAAVSKLGNPAAFAKQIGHYDVLPQAANALAIVLPWLELIVALAFLSGFWSDAAARVAAVLTAIFLAAMTQALVRGLQIECGCFAWESPLTWGSLARDGLLLVLPLAPLLRRS